MRRVSVLFFLALAFLVISIRASNQFRTQSPRSPRSAGRRHVRLWGNGINIEFFDWLSRVTNNDRYPRFLGFKIPFPQSLTWRLLPLTEETVDSGHEIGKQQAKPAGLIN